jgi:hypothetical protein
VKFTFQLVSLILGVKHNLCYWISNKPCKTSDFPKYNRLPNITIIEEKHRYRYMYICMHNCSHMRLFLPYVYYTVWCLSKSYAHNNCKLHIIVKNNLLKKRKNRKETQQHRVGTNVRVRGFNAGLMARSQFAFGRSCDRPTRSRFSVAFLGPRANAELVPKFHVALHASHAALPMVALEISLCTNVT